MVPGITAAQGAAASLGLPLTNREHARRLQYVTHAREGRLPPDLDWRSLADPSATAAIYMPTRTLADLAQRAIAAGLDPQTPAVAIARATRSDQTILSAPIAQLAERLTAETLPGPIGDARLRFFKLEFHIYDAAHTICDSFELTHHGSASPRRKSSIIFCSAAYMSLPMDVLQPIRCAASTIGETAGDVMTQPTNISGLKRAASIG